MKKQLPIFLFVLCALVLFDRAPTAAALALYSPGETLNPSCAPTDPDCTVSIPRLSNTIVVADLTERDALTNLQAGDIVVVTDVNQTFVRTQSDTWQKFSKALLANVYLVEDVAERDALTNLQAGDIVVVADGTNETFVRTQSGTWQIFSKTLLANAYVVPDMDALNALTGLQAGDTAAVTSVSKSFVRTQSATWQELLSLPSTVFINKTYVVADVAARDALSAIAVGDIAVVTDSNTTYIFTQENTWQQLLTPATDAVLSVNGNTGAVVLTTDDVSEGVTNKYFSDTRSRGAFSASGPLSYNSLSGLFSLTFSSPLILNGSSLTVDPTALDLSTFGGILSIAKGGTGATTPAAAILGLLPSVSGNSGKFLTTDGSTVSWDSVAMGGSDWGSITGKPTTLAGYGITDGFSGAYADLTGKPTLFSGSFTDLTNVPTFFSGAYGDLTGLPSLFDGAFTSLTGTPTTLTGYGITDALKTTNNLSDVTDASLARTNLGLIIGTDVLAPSGNGSQLTDITATQVGLGNVPNVDTTNATNITSGTLANVRLSSSVTLLGNTFNGASQLVQLAATGKLPALDGSALTGVVASVLAWGGITGTLANQTDLVSALAAKEPTITAGTSAQYYRGDKTWQILNSISVGLGNVENTTLSTWAGSSALTTLGTITSGTWNGTSIAVANGGTGATTAATARGNLGLGTLATQSGTFSGVSSGTNTGDVTLGTANGLSLSAQALSLGLSSVSTTGALSSTDWSTFNAKGSGSVTSVNGSGDTTGLTLTGGPITTSGTLTLGGTLTIANGGTGSTTKAAAFDALSPMTTIGDIIYGGVSGTGTRLVGAVGFLKSTGAAAPTWSAVSLTADVSGILPIANGGTNSTASPTAGGAVYGTGSAYAVTAAGASGQVLKSNGAAAPTWVDAGSAMLAGLSGNAIVNNSTLYFPITSSGAGNGTDAQSGTRTLISRNGTIKNFHVLLSAAIGALKTGSVTVMKNGVATALVATLDTTSTAFSDTSDTLSVVAGDEIGIRVTVTSNTSKFSWSADFTY